MTKTQRETVRRRRYRYIDWPPARLGWSLKGQPRRSWRRSDGSHRRPGHGGLMLAQGRGNRIEVRRAPAGGGMRTQRGDETRGGDPALVHATRTPPWVTRRRNRQRNRVARASRKANRR